MRFSDDKIVEWEWKVGGETVTWGVKCYDSFSCKLDKPVRSIRISKHYSDEYGPYHVINFYDAEGNYIDFFGLYTSFYPENYVGETIKLKEGYELIGFAISATPDGSIESLAFKAWKLPMVKK